MAVVVIDLNADVGEHPGQDGVAADRAILAGISSVNIACGFHAGDGATMHALCELASAMRKRIGAHVSYLDPEHFGRRDLDVDGETLKDHIGQQIAALQAEAGVVGARVSYVKPHGALYNRAAVDAERAEVVAAATAAAPGQPLALLGPPGSELLAAAARHGLPAVSEGFADRGYLADGTLVPRGQPGAVLAPEAAIGQSCRIAIQAHADATDGTAVPLHVRSLCLHSDTPGAAELAIAIRNRLIGAGVEIRPFT